MLARGKGDDKLFDKRGHIAVRYYLALPFLDAEGRCRHGDVHVGLDLALAGQAPVLFHFLTCEVHGLGGQRVAASAGYLQAALAATALAATCRWQEDVVVGHCRQQWLAGGGGDFFIVVYGDFDWSRLHQVALGDKQYYHQEQSDAEEEADTGLDGEPRRVVELADDITECH